VPTRLAELGTRLRAGARDLFEREELGDVFKLTGHPSWTFLSIAATARATQYEIKTLLLQELFARGILSLGTHNLSAAHTEAHIDKLLAVYAEVLPFVAERARAGRVRDALRTEPLIPLFAVR
jgi:glutamate-1-semialdehyde 2,1-aminomutase